MFLQSEHLNEKGATEGTWGKGRFLFFIFHSFSFFYILKAFFCRRVSLTSSSRNRLRVYSRYSKYCRLTWRRNEYLVSKLGMVAR